MSILKLTANNTSVMVPIDISLIMDASIGLRESNPELSKTLADIVIDNIKQTTTEGETTETKLPGGKITEAEAKTNGDTDSCPCFKVPDKFYKTLNVEVEVENGNLNYSIIDELKSNGFKNIRFLIGNQDQLGVELYFPKHRKPATFFINRNEVNRLTKCTDVILKAIRRKENIGYYYEEGEGYLKDKIYGPYEDHSSYFTLKYVQQLGVYGKTRGLSVEYRDNSICVTKQKGPKLEFDESLDLHGEYILYLLFKFLESNDIQSK